MYDIVFRQIATNEYVEAIKLYKEKSIPIADGFVIAVNDKLDQISSYPRQYKNLYKNYHETSLKKYPYTIVYLIEDKEW